MTSDALLAEVAACEKSIAGGDRPGNGPAMLQAAEDLLSGPEVERGPVELWHRYLDCSRKSPFLKSLADMGARERWAETAFQAIRHSGYTLETMLDQRVKAHPRRTLFHELGRQNEQGWTYAGAARRIRSLAAALLDGQAEAPRVAILASANGFDAACCDLACLTYGIFVSPLSPHFPADVLAWIFERTSIDTVITDTAELQGRLETVRDTVKRPFRIHQLDPQSCSDGPDDVRLVAAATRLGTERVKEILDRRTRPGLDDPATAMFTSGSTGLPKGVLFTAYNLISKRFARAAALPDVGEKELLISYLPLYHTFGRYLEMMGMLFWGGTYVFAKNPSIQTLAAGMSSWGPTGLISIPRRWAQLHERCLEAMGEDRSPEARAAAVKATVGGRLRWGLSAAGYLDPQVFHFFQDSGVDLCCGFGMTEATGGITMTPPGAYEDNTVGIPLPGVRARLGEGGELQLTGEYIARYIDDPEPAAGEDYWLPTGDVFQVRESGYYEIVDRIKDIYKNSRGQTVAPRQTEQQFAEVPGISRTFLVGDGRAYNVLLIVPDREDPVISGLPSENEVNDYLHQIVAAANLKVAPYQRVVNFAVLHRDFETAREELTPKGSYRRKVIEANFSGLIDSLFEKDYVELELEGFAVRVPRWFFRDLGILVTDIVIAGGGLLNRRTSAFLPLAAEPGDGLVRVGDLAYAIDGPVIDLGLFAHQPQLWAANPSLTAFAPCRESWDRKLNGIAEQVFLPAGREERPTAVNGQTSAAGSGELARAGSLCATALFAPEKEALAALRTLESELKAVGHRTTRVIRRRLEALARHPDNTVRCEAYKVLLLDEPQVDYSQLLPSFLESGRPFLNEESMAAIASSGFGIRRLDALRQRLHAYRTRLSWPASDAVRAQFTDVFRLLDRFVRQNIRYYGAVRAELVSWILHRGDPQLAADAEAIFSELGDWFEARLAEECDQRAGQWEGKIIFQAGLPQGEIDHLKKILIGTTFLKESIMLAFSQQASFDIGQVPPAGIWITRVNSVGTQRLYRVSVNTDSGRHYDLLITVRPDLDEARVHQTNLWLITIYGHTHGVPVVPHFGCCRPALGALSLAFVGGQTVWNLIHEISERRSRSPRGRGKSWEPLFIRGMAAYFTGWRNSGRQIVPGTVSPRNTVVPLDDWREGGQILSLAGWEPYDGPISLVAPMLRWFYLQTAHHYPWSGGELDPGWIFEACIEALGIEEAALFLEELEQDLARQPVPGDNESFTRRLREQRERLRTAHHPPLALRCAIDRYGQWEAQTPEATPRAREQMAGELHRLYRLRRHGEITRYHLFLETYFRKADPRVREAFGAMLEAMFRHPGAHPTQLQELSELKATLADDEDRLVFSRLIFPLLKQDQPLELIAVGGDRQLVVSSHITDRHGTTYAVREPLGPREIGRLYRLFLKRGQPMKLSAEDRHLLVVDGDDQIVGGVRYRVEEDGLVQLEGITVMPSLRRRGIRSALLEDFCTRMAELGAMLVRTHFSGSSFFSPRGFQLDNRWGGLVRYLGEAESPSM